MPQIRGGNIAYTYQPSTNLTPSFVFICRKLSNQLDTCYGGGQEAIPALFLIKM